MCWDPDPKWERPLQVCVPSYLGFGKAGSAGCVCGGNKKVWRCTDWEGLEEPHPSLTPQLSSDGCAILSFVVLHPGILAVPLNL